MFDIIRLQKSAMVSGLPTCLSDSPVHHPGQFLQEIDEHALLQEELQEKIVLMALKDGYPPSDNCEALKMKRENSSNLHQTFQGYLDMLCALNSLQIKNNQRKETIRRYPCFLTGELFDFTNNVKNSKNLSVIFGAKNETEVFQCLHCRKN